MVPVCPRAATQPFLLRALTVAVAIALQLAGCTSWRVQSVAPEQLLAAEHPGQVRVQTRDGTRIVLRDPRLARDSLMGRVSAPPSWAGPPGQSEGTLRYAVALADVTQVAVRRTNALKTIGLILAIPAGAIAILGATCGYSSDCTN
jgi:hypothetical protein